MILTYDFLLSSSYIFDSGKINFSPGNVKLQLEQGNVDYTEDFSSDTGFTYDNTKAEFTGGKVQAKSQRPVGSTIGITYTVDEDASWGDGVLTGILNGGATVSAGRLWLTGGANKCAIYSGIGNANSPNVGTWKFKLTPNWNGAYGSALCFMSAGNQGNLNNRMQLIVDAAGRLAFNAYDKNGNPITPGNALFLAALWNAVSGLTYEFEFNYNFITGDMRLFIDGVQWGSTLSYPSADRDSNIADLVVGASISFTSSVEGYMDDVVLFSTVQHTANYTPGYTLPETDYIENSVILPEMPHAGDGTFKAFNTFLTIEAGTPKYTVQIGRSGNYLYWTGIAWAVSDGTYSQANSQSVFNINSPALPVNGEEYIQFKIIFPDSNIQANVSNLAANMNVDIGYYTTSPKIKPSGYIRTDSITSISITSIIIGSDNIFLTIEKNGTEYYHDGSGWKESSGSSQVNTLSEINANISTFLNSIPADIRPVWFLYSDDGSSTPEMTESSVYYDFAGDEEDINTCKVWGYNFDFGPDINSFSVRRSQDAVKYKNSTILRGNRYTVTPVTGGYWEVEIVETENMEGNIFYIFNFNGTEFYKKIPNEPESNFWDLEDAD